MELRQLRYFLALARELHFGRAAASVNLSQPPLSRQIKDLEHELGVVLFARNNRTVRLTEPGRIFLGHVQRAFESLDEATRSARLAARGQVGRLGLGYLGASAHSVLPKLLRRFRKEHPQVELALNEMTTPEQCDALVAGIIDIGIMRPSMRLRDFRSEIILREPFVVALPAEHRFAHCRSVPMASLAGERFIMLPPAAGGGLPRQILELCLGAQFEPQVAQVATQTLSIIGLVGAGTGIAIVPQSVQEMNVPNVVYRPLGGVADFAETAVVWRKADETPVVTAFLTAVREASAVEAHQPIDPPR